MTSNQIAYLNTQENIRSNRAREVETNRHNLVTEQQGADEILRKRQRDVGDLSNTMFANQISSARQQADAEQGWRRLADEREYRKAQIRSQERMNEANNYFKKLIADDDRNSREGIAADDRSSRESIESKKISSNERMSALDRSLKREQSDLDRRTTFLVNAMKNALEKELKLLDLETLGPLRQAQAQYATNQAYAILPEAQEGQFLGEYGGVLKGFEDMSKAGQQWVGLGLQLWDMVDRLFG